MPLDPDSTYCDYDSEYEEYDTDYNIDYEEEEEDSEYSFHRENLDYPYEWASNLIYRWDANILKYKKVQLDPSVRYLGVELEYIFKDVVTRDEFKKVASILLDQPWSKDIILVHDGSFRDQGHGAEIVTIPLKFNELLQLGRDILDRKNSKVVDYLAVASSTGMHVHVSKSSMSLLTEAKILKFVYDNASWFIKVTGKRSPNYASYHPEATKWTSRIFIKDKYVAVNTKNSKTLEFRFFTAPLTFTGYRNRLCFVKALIDYCENTPPYALSIDSFKNSPYLAKVDLNNVSNY